MGLILAGDINTEALLPLLERTFGQLERGVKPVRDRIVAPAIVGQPVEKFLFPMPIIGMSAMVFRGPTDYDPDAPAMKVALALLNNDNQTAALAVMVVPKLLCRVKTAENLCLEQIGKLKKGDFTDEQLQAVKKMLAQDNQKGLESITKRSELMVEAMSAGVSWEEYLRLTSSIDGITRDDVIGVANKYFTDNFYRFHKKNGRMPADQIAKPEYTPVKPKHTNDQSAYAKRLEQLPVKDVAPRLVDFNQDVEKVTLNGGKLYASSNPLNDDHLSPQGHTAGQVAGSCCRVCGRTGYRFS